MFITFEGLDGSGKTTQVPLLAEALRARGHAVLLAREPGGTGIGDQIRTVLHDTANGAMRAEAELLLYSAARAQLVGEVVRPHLAQGGIVLCDRYADSTFAYQGYGRGLDLAVLRTITGFATQGLVPDLTLYFDLPVDVALGRRRATQDLNRMDQQTRAFYARVHAGYATLSAAEPARWARVAADETVAGVQAQVLAVVAARLG